MRIESTLLGTFAAVMKSGHSHSRCSTMMGYKLNDVVKSRGNEHEREIRQWRKQGQAVFLLKFMLSEFIFSTQRINKLGSSIGSLSTRTRAPPSSSLILVESLMKLDQKICSGLDWGEMVL